MKGSGSLVLILFSATAAVAISIDNIQRDIKTPNITPPSHQQHIKQLPHHLRTTNRQLRSEDISTIEFCGKCTWQGNISCEARAQYLVRNSPQSSSNLSLQDARISIFETCKSDGSDLSSIPIDAFCGSCQYMKMNFNCNSRVDYLVTTYYLGREKAIESLLKDGHCINVNWVPPNTTIDDTNSDNSLSNGAIIGIVIGITILLCCCIGLCTALYYNKKKLLEEQTATQQASNQPAGSKRAKASEIRKKVMAEANARNNTDTSPDSSSLEEDIKKKKSLSFAPPVVWNITSDDGDKPDPPTQDEVINKEKNEEKEMDNTQQVLDMMESALDATKTNNNNEDPPDFRDSTISELSCNIDPPTDDEEEGVVLPSTMDEEQTLSNTNGYVNSSGQVVVNKKQDALAIDNETKQNEETEGIVRRISLEP